MKTCVLHTQKYEKIKTTGILNIIHNCIYRVKVNKTLYFLSTYLVESELRERERERERELLH